MLLLILPAILIAVLATWFGVTKKRGVEYVKASFPLYLSIFVFRSFWLNPSYLIGGILLGLCFCAAADFLLGKRDNTAVFVYGLVGFLLGYLTYGVAFFIAAGLSTTFYLLALILVFLGVYQYRTLRTLPPAMRIPIILYMTVVSFFLASAASYGIKGNTFYPVLGALLIYASDSLIAHNLFRSPLEKSDLWILPPYYAGQMLIVLTFQVFSTAA